MSNSNIIIRSNTNGYVVENFDNAPVMKPNSPHYGKVFPYKTRNGRYAIFPDWQSIPPNWRPYAVPASDQQVANGWPMDRVVHVEETEDFKTGKRSSILVKQGGKWQ